MFGPRWGAQKRATSAHVGQARECIKNLILDRSMRPVLVQSVVDGCLCALRRRLHRHTV